MIFRRKENREKSALKRMATFIETTSKQLVWFYSINGVLWIWCSYILAFQGKVQIAETLSSNVCSVIIGQIGFYFITKTVENVFKHNVFSWTKKKNNITESEGDSGITVPEPTFDMSGTPPHSVTYDPSLMAMNEEVFDDGSEDEFPEACG